MHKKAKPAKPAEVVGLVVELEPALHRALKHRAIDDRVTLQKLARDILAEAMNRGNEARGGEKAAAA